MRTLRSTFGTLLALALGAALAAPAAAAPLPFTATLKLEIGSFGTVTVNGGGVGDFGPNGGTATVPAGVFSIGDTQMFPPGLTYGGIIRGFAVAGPGQFGANAPFASGTNLAFQFNGATGTMGLNASFYMLDKNGKAGGAIPLAKVGVGGTETFGPIFGVIFGTVLANPYKLGMVTVAGSWVGNNVTLSASGFDNRNASGVGVLQVVSPTSFELGTIGDIAAIATLTITTVPEPTTFVLLGAGIAAIGVLARRRA